jgi:hypothetical protein
MSVDQSDGDQGDSIRSIVILHVESVAKTEHTKHENDAPSTEYASAAALRWDEAWLQGAVFCDIYFDIELDSTTSLTITSQLLNDDATRRVTASSAALDQSYGDSDGSDQSHRELRMRLRDDVQHNVQILRKRAVYYGGFPRRWQIFRVAKRVRSMSMANCYVEVPRWNVSKTAIPSANVFSAPVKAVRREFTWESTPTAPMHLYAQLDVAEAEETYKEAFLSESRITDGVANENFVPEQKEVRNRGDLAEEELVEDTVVASSQVLATEAEQATACAPIAEEAFGHLWHEHFNNTILAHRLRVDLDHSSLFRSNMELLMKQEMRDINILLATLGVIAFSLAVVLVSMVCRNGGDRKRSCSESCNLSLAGKAKLAEGSSFNNVNAADCLNRDCRYLPLTPTIDGTVSPLSDEDRQLARQLSPCSKLQVHWWNSRATRRQNRAARVVTPAASIPDAVMVHSELADCDANELQGSGSINQRLFLRPISPIVSPSRSLATECPNLDPSALMNEKLVCSERDSRGSVVNGLSLESVRPCDDVDAPVVAQPVASRKSHPPAALSAAHSFIEDYW